MLVVGILFVLDPYWISRLKRPAGAAFPTAFRGIVKPNRSQQEIEMCSCGDPFSAAARRWTGAANDDSRS
jgi:hypothetical protein